MTSHQPRPLPSLLEPYPPQETTATPNGNDPHCFTSLDEHIEDCGNSKITCPDQQTVSFYCQNDGNLHLFLVVCKRWGCPYCGRIKRAKLLADVTAARPNRFLTLTTCGQASETPRQIFDWTRRQISELAKIIRRDHREFEYLRCLEATKQGFPHYHLLIRSGYLDQAELSRHWCHLTRAYIVDIRKLTRDEKAARYVMKYLTKQHAVPFTNRRLSWTRGFFPPKEPEQPSPYAPIMVQRTNGDLEHFTYWNCPGATVQRVNKWHWIIEGTKQ